MNIDELPTPCALVDRDRVDANTAAMSARARALGVRLRPHVKTHKCAEAARLQTRGGAAGITVSTLAEARAFAAAGFDDITWAFPLPPDRAAEAVALAGEVARLHLLLDHADAADALERAARDAGRPASVLLEVDCGDHRGGVDPTSDASVALARRLHGSSHLDLLGVLTHGGHAYAARDRAGVAPIAAEERDVAVGFASRLEEEGIEVREVSVGSTPTMRVVDDLTGVTEIRPGNYVYFDAFQAAIGSCALDEVAFSVLATVVGAYPDQERIVVNAGALALSKDEGPTHVDPGCGYGVVATSDGATLLPELRVFSLSQEHGQIRGPGVTDRFRVGDRLRVLPNHSCLAAAQFDVMHVTAGAEVVETWTPARGW